MSNPTSLPLDPGGQASARESTLIRPGVIAGALTAILLLNVLASLFWIDQNIVLIGNDASGYLSTTLEYARHFTTLSPATLFQAFTAPEYRTPGLFLAAQPFFWLFGAFRLACRLSRLFCLMLPDRVER